MMYVKEEEDFGRGKQKSKKPPSLHREVIPRVDADSGVLCGQQHF